MTLFVTTCLVCVVGTLLVYLVHQAPPRRRSVPRAERVRRLRRAERKELETLRAHYARDQRIAELERELGIGRYDKEN